MPEPDPPITRTFLLRSSLGSWSALDMARETCRVRMMLFLGSPRSANALASLGLAHLALPCSSPLLCSPARETLLAQASQTPAAQASPTASGIGSALGEAVPAMIPERTPRTVDSGSAGAPAGSAAAAMSPIANAAAESPAAVAAPVPRALTSTSSPRGSAPARGRVPCHATGPRRPSSHAPPSP